MEVLKLITGSFNMCEALRRQGVEQNSLFHWYKGADDKMAVGMMAAPEPENVSAWTVGELAAAIGPLGHPAPVAFMPPGALKEIGPGGKMVDQKPHWLFFTINKSQPVKTMPDAYIALTIHLLAVGDLDAETFNRRLVAFREGK
jgi:hypothetical protein